MWRNRAAERSPALACAVSHNNSMIRIILLTVIAAMLAFSDIPQALAGQDVQAQLAQVKKERARLKVIRQQLEGRLGALGKQLLRMDSDLVKARQASRSADKAVQKVDHSLARLAVRRQHLEDRVARLRRQMLDEAVAAYKRAGRPMVWLSFVQGVSMAEIPHRQYMVASLLSAQAEERRLFLASVAELSKVEEESRQQRVRLARLLKQKRQAEMELATRVLEKRKLWQKVKQDAQLKIARDKQLARQEKALQRLLAGLGSTLLEREKATKWVSVRKRKGRLPWPLKGKLVVRFGQKQPTGRGRMTGVQLAPQGAARQVKAIAAGQVRYADWFGGYGLMMIVDHGEGMMSVYAHNDILYRRLGDWVEGGEVLADAGNTGWVENVRLYFEIRDAGEAVNPARWCRK